MTVALSALALLLAFALFAGGAYFREHTIQLISAGLAAVVAYILLSLAGLH